LVDFFLRLAAILIPFLDDWKLLQDDKEIMSVWNTLHANLHATGGHPVAIYNTTTIALLPEIQYTVFLRRLAANRTQIEPHCKKG
jgi:hypothetical protein